MITPAVRTAITRRVTELLYAAPPMTAEQRAAAVRILAAARPATGARRDSAVPSPRRAAA